MIFRSLLLGGLLALTALAARAAEPLSTLAPRPDWEELERYQQTITRAEFLRLLNTVYAPGGWNGAIDVREREAVIRQPGTGKVDFRLRFAESAKAARPVPRYWAAAGSRPEKPGKPLAGYTIALDPGHIGGSWAKMEERWFQIGRSKPVMEGEMALVVARHLANRLEALGAKVVFVRNRTEPVTRLRPKALRKAATAELRREGVRSIRAGYSGPDDPHKEESVQWKSELLFYRVSEIRARAEVVNERLRPDLVICLHFNAEAWGNPADPRLTDRNHLHLLVNGNYSPGELEKADIRFDLLFKLLNRSAREELPLSDRVAASLAKATGLPPYTYGDGRARRVTPSPYVWARNLLANRLYRCPVVYCEPYVMNSQAVFDRIQMGDYKGTRVIGGAPRKSIFREYADAVAAGVASHFAKAERD